MSSNIDWIIHYCANICDDCGELETGYLPYACNAHTHGMGKYGHKDFQIVLALPVTEACRVLNSLGCRVQAGEQFKTGDYIAGIYTNCDIRLDEYEETGRNVLRVIIPDRDNRYPEHPACMYPYSLQLLKTDDLYKK